MSTIIPPCPSWCSGDHRSAGVHRADVAELRVGAGVVVDVACVQYDHPSLPGPRVSVGRHSVEETAVLDLTPAQADMLASTVLDLSSWSARLDFATALTRAAGMLFRSEP